MPVSPNILFDDDVDSKHLILFLSPRAINCFTATKLLVSAMAECGSPEIGILYDIDKKPHWAVVFEIPEDCLFFAFKYPTLVL